MDSSVCFSPGALTLLGAVAVVLQGAIAALFVALLKSKDDSINEAREERDRAAGNLERALNIGETAVRQPPARRRPS